MSSYRCVFLMGVEQALEYRVSFFLSMLSAAFPIIIQTAMWNYLYGHSDAAAIFGYLNKYLIRPVGYTGYQFFRFLGQKVPRVMVIVPVMAAMIGLAFWQGMPVSAGRVLAFLVSLGLALLLNFSIFYCVGLLGFWLTDVDKLFGTISVVLTVASGGVFPLDIFGGMAEILTGLLPFGYTAQFPVNIINGRFGWARIGAGIAFQIGWIFFFACLGNVMWRRGLKRYAAVGG